MLKQKRLMVVWLGLQLAFLLLLQEAFTLWVSLLFAALLLTRFTTLVYANTSLSLKAVNFIGAGVAVALLFNIKQAGVLNFMLQILLLAAMLRLLALRQLFEARQLVWVHYFLIGCCFILHQNMLVALVIMAALFANIYSHYLLFAPAGSTLKPGNIGRATLIILPLWLAMFLLFPRLPPFWQIPTAKVASTGLSDTLDPGSIEQLVKDDSLAFRVEFENGVPERQLLYWRARLYEDFDGRRWQENPLRAGSNYRNINQANTSAEATLKYRIIAEASQQRSLFALASPFQSSANVNIAPSGLVLSTKPVSQRISYQLSSQLQPVTILSEQEQQLNLHIPAGNEQTLAFGRQLKAQHPQVPALVDAIASHFRQQPYFYSLTPPLLGANSVDQFLFDSRTGFCSHYASATALLLRAAGIPARVVGGYQGGDWHPEQGYLAVRQREAHAWVEYADQGRWQQFDPTAAVAPQRILSSLDDALSAEQRQLLSSPWQRNALLNNLRQQLMHLDYYWSVWVLGFNDDNQRDLWQQLRQNLQRFAYGLALITVLALLVVALLWWQRRERPTQPQAYRLVSKLLSGVLQHKPIEQPLSEFLCLLAQQQEAEQRQLLLALVKYYELALFNDDTTALSLLKQQLKQHRNTLRKLHFSAQNT